LDPDPYPDPYPDPLIRCTDPRIRSRICTKKSRIRNTACRGLKPGIPRIADSDNQGTYISYCETNMDTDGIQQSDCRIVAKCRKKLLEYHTSPVDNRNLLNNGGVEAQNGAPEGRPVVADSKPLMRSRIRIRIRIQIKVMRIFRPGLYGTGVGS
jgi:hypothetical protein